MNDNIGSTLQNGMEKAYKALAIIAGIVVYLGMLAFSGVHNYTLMTRGVNPDLLFWAVLGVFTLEISAAALPIALHSWTYAPTQRLAAYAFYGLDFAIIFLNVLLDFAMNTGETMPPWMQLYLMYFAPATPIIPGIGWSILFLLDPSHQARAVAESLKAAAVMTLAAKIEKRTKEADINSLVDDAAAEMARALVAQAMGASVERAGGRLPASIVDAAARNGSNNGNHKDRSRPILFHPRIKTSQEQSYNSETTPTDGSRLPQPPDTILEGQTLQKIEGGANPTQPGNGRK